MNKNKIVRITIVPTCNDNEHNRFILEKHGNDTLYV